MTDINSLDSKKTRGLLNNENGRLLLVFFFVVVSDDSLV